MKSSLLLLTLALASPALSGCGILIGNAKTVAEKSESYRALNLSEQNPDWKRLESAPSTDSSDLAYQSQRTAAIISLNSACRPASSKESLSEVSRLLFLGILDVSEREERETRVDEQPALETTVRGVLNQEPVKLRAVVVRKAECVYDLMLIARPETFSNHEADFGRFVSSLRLR